MSEYIWPECEHYCDLVDYYGEEKAHNITAFGAIRIIGKGDVPDVFKLVWTFQSLYISGVGENRECFTKSELNEKYGATGWCYIQCAEAMSKFQRDKWSCNPFLFYFDGIGELMRRFATDGIRDDCLVDVLEGIPQHTRWDWLK